jgi:hypothetical protein
MAQLTMAVTRNGRMVDAPIGTLDRNDTDTFTTITDTGFKMNPKWDAKSLWRREPITFFSRSAAEFWLRTIGEVELICEERAR